MNDYLSRAIKRLKPTSEFSYDNRDYSTIKWDVLEGEAPTKKEIDDAIKAIKTEEANKAETQATAKAAAQAKLAALGLTVADLEALGL